MHRKRGSFECTRVAKSVQIRFHRLTRKTNRKPPVCFIGVLGLYKHGRLVFTDRVNCFIINNDRQKI